MDDDKFVLSVFELNTYVSDRLYQDPFLEEVWVSGEVINLSLRHNTAYFSLTDGDASVDCILFEFAECGYGDIISDGQEVLLRGNISLYRKNGSFRIVVENVQLTGLGEMYERFNRLKAKLEGMGVFAAERKRKIPLYPKRIGIVTSREGAAVHDITTIARRRSPIVKLTLYPVKVQGADAPDEIAEAIRYFNSAGGVDVLIVGRGGGASEDLFAFNDERVVMEIYNSEIPVISAVGHESDYTLADMAADLRAPTPSAAAELAVPVVDDVLEQVFAMRVAIKSGMARRLNDMAALLRLERQKLSPERMALRLRSARHISREHLQRMKFKVNELYNKVFLSYNTGKTKLAGLNPEDIFRRGYSIAMKDGFVVNHAAGIEPGDVLDIHFQDGTVHALVQKKEVN